MVFIKIQNEEKFLDFTTDDVAPISIMDSTYFHKISSTISLAREKFLNDLIENKLNKYSKVLVIYGGGHLVKSRFVYESHFFSQSKNNQPF